MTYEPLTRQQAEKVLARDECLAPEVAETKREREVAGATKTPEALLYAILEIIEEERAWDNNRLMSKSLHERTEEACEDYSKREYWMKRYGDMSDRYKHLYDTVLRIEDMLSYARTWRDVSRQRANEGEFRT